VTINLIIVSEATFVSEVTGVNGKFRLSQKIKQ